MVDRGLRLPLTRRVEPLETEDASGPDTGLCNRIERREILIDPLCECKLDCVVAAVRGKTTVNVEPCPSCDWQQM
jgi:hypothetical protein